MGEGGTGAHHGGPHGHGDVVASGTNLITGCFWSIVWIFVLIFFAWPVAFIVGAIWIIAMPFGACMEFFRETVELLESIVKLPQTCAANIFTQKPLYDAIN